MVKQPAEMFTKNGFTIMFTLNGNDVDADCVKKIADVYFDVYPKMHQRFNKEATKIINIKKMGKIDGMYATSSIQNNSIFFNPDYLKDCNDVLLETFCHELAHMLQTYKSPAGAYLKEGIADYINYYYGKTTDAWRIDSFAHTPQNDVRWNSGYHHTAKFLMWLDEQYDGFTQKLNFDCINGLYNKEEYFKKQTGFTEAQLWEKYVAASKINQ